MQKRILILMFIMFVTISYAQEIHLNDFGRIVRARKNSSKISRFMKDGIFWINYQNMNFKGNSIFDIYEGFLTLTTIEGSIPTQFRIYNKEGKLKRLEEYDKVINITFSPNKKYCVFFTGKKIICYNLVNLTCENFPESVLLNIDNAGNPIFVYKNFINYKDLKFQIDEQVYKIIFFRSLPLILTEKIIFTIKRGKLLKLFITKNTFFDIKTDNNYLYFVDNEEINQGNRFCLYCTENLKTKKMIETQKIELSSREHEDIQSPLNFNEENYLALIGNSYGEIQNYSGNPYLHPGVDFLGDDYQEVYAVRDGYVKDILTTGGAPYWRIAIANQDVTTEVEGYLYAHLNQNSITVNIGDYVNAGELIGTLYPWGWYDFTHIHFARIVSEGQTWNGNWWTTDNPHIDVVNVQDTIPPSLEDVFTDEEFAFRDQQGNYLEPLNLSGEFDIIAKCHDIANSDWRIDVWDLSFSLEEIDNPDSIVYEKFSFSYDFPLDTYVSGENEYEMMVLNTIYSTDDICYSNGNYDVRNYYHIITNSDGDSLINEYDAAQNFNSTEFVDGFYLLKVTARDAAYNETTETMIINLNNDNSGNNAAVTPKINLSQNYPNPFNLNHKLRNNYTKIDYYLPTNSRGMIKIYNLKGQNIKNFKIGYDADNSISWFGKDKYNKEVASGIYLYKLITPDLVRVKKMILTK